MSFRMRPRGPAGGAAPPPPPAQKNGMVLKPSDTIYDSQQLTNDYFDRYIEIDATRKSVNIALPKVEASTKNKTITIRRSDSADNGNEVLIFPFKGDRIEARAPGGPWIPNIGSCFGLGFGDVIILKNDGKSNWVFIKRPRIDTINQVKDEANVTLHDLDRTIIVECKTRDCNVKLQSAVGKGGRVLNIKNHPFSLYKLIVYPFSRQNIDGCNKLELQPGDCRGIVSDDLNWHIIYGFTVKDN